MAGIFSEEGLLKKHPLRGSSLSQRFASLAGEAGLGAEYMSPKGLTDATSKLSSYTKELGKDLPDLTQKTADTAKNIAKAQEKLKQAQDKQNIARRQEQSVELQIEAFKPKQVKKGKTDVLKLHKEKYTNAVNETQSQIDILNSKIEQYNAQLQEQQARVRTSRIKQQDGAAFRNFVSAYAKAIGDGANREQFLASVHGQIGPSPEVAAELSTVSDRYQQIHENIMNEQMKSNEDKTAALIAYEQAQEMKSQVLMKNKIRKSMGLSSIKKKDRANKLRDANVRLQEALVKQQEVSDTSELGKLKGEAAQIAKRGQELEQRAALESAGLGYIFG